MPQNGGEPLESRPGQAESVFTRLAPRPCWKRKNKANAASFSRCPLCDGRFFGMLWRFECPFLKSSSGRKRYNMLDTFSVKGTELITLTNDACINSNTLVDLLTAVNRLCPDTGITLVMDNARYQRCDKMIDNSKKAASTCFFCRLIRRIKLDRMFAEIDQKAMPLQSLRNPFINSRQPLTTALTR
jgi:hypothetical protein